MFEEMEATPSRISGKKIFIYVSYVTLANAGIQHQNINVKTEDTYLIF